MRARAGGVAPRRCSRRSKSSSARWTAARSARLAARATAPGPNAIVRARGRPPKVHVRLRSLEASARVAESATGRPAKLDEQASGRLGQLRAVRARQRATSLSLWNAALKGIAEEAETRPALRAELQSLLANAGFPNGIGPLLPLSPTMPASILNYSPWALQGVTPVSTHSAIFRLASADRKRGTPHVRGSGRLPVPNTWHTTMLAKVGPNDEGPLPWIERDYTPISSAKEWEQGRLRAPRQNLPEWRRDVVAGGARRRRWRRARLALQAREDAARARPHRRGRRRTAAPSPRERAPVVAGPVLSRCRSSSLTATR